MDQIKERCIYCGGDVYYTGAETLIKCDKCGNTLVVAKFENELARMNQAIEEGETAKRRLEEAEKEKQAANDRLFAALSSLDEIRDEQDSFGKVLHLLTDKQGDALEYLQFLKKISGQIIDSQNDIFAQMDVINEIRARLQKSEVNDQEQRAALTEFMAWSQQIRKEDVDRLQWIVSKADNLLTGQQKIRNKVDELKRAADLHQQTLEAFRGQYTKDKLEKIKKLYRQAGDYQHDRRYDKAEEYYHRMLTEGGGDAEVYWRLIMCHYCLFYEKDENREMIPIILNPDLTDPAEMSLRKELAAHMTDQEKPFYEAELQKIDRILDKYRLLKDQVQYDIFISVKQDDGGHYTSDSDVASDLYDFLTGHGLRVFNSRRTPIPAGHEYEPYIISALISAKVLIVVGTTPDNMNSNWVKNEWSRFQWLQFRGKERTGKTDRVLFCYLAKGMRAEEIPRALHPNRQAIYDGVKAHDELLMAIAFLKKTGIQTGGTGYIPTPLPKPDYGKVKKQMTAWLVIGKYEKVQKKYDELLDEGSFLEHASLHLAALCARNKVADIDQIVNSVFILEDAPEYKAAVRLCDDEEEKKELEALLAQNRSWRNKQNSKVSTINNKETKPVEQEMIPVKDKQVTSKTEAEEWYKCGLKAYDKQDYGEAVKWYQKAAEHGHAIAQYSLGRLYYNGKGVEKDPKQAVYWYQKAAEQGNPNAQDILGWCYYYGEGVEKDKKQAVYWYKKAADQGYAIAQFCLGVHYHYSNGVEKDLKQAVYWYRKAAAQGRTDAQFNLALCYENGDGVEKDQKQAVYWYQKAAEQGRAIAQYYLALCYENGDGVEKDQKQAAYWHQKAADQGLEKSKERIKELSGKKS